MTRALLALAAAWALAAALRPLLGRPLLRPAPPARSTDAAWRRGVFLVALLATGTATAQPADLGGEKPAPAVGGLFQGAAVAIPDDALAAEAEVDPIVQATCVPLERFVALGGAFVGRCTITGRVFAYSYRYPDAKGRERWLVRMCPRAQPEDGRIECDGGPPLSRGRYNAFRQAHADPAGFRWFTNVADGLALGLPAAADPKD